MSRSPIEIMIDEACGYDPSAQEKQSKDEFREDFAQAVLNHIDTMYPSMWDGVPKTARTSIRNFIRSRIK